MAQEEFIHCRKGGGMRGYFVCKDWQGESGIWHSTCIHKLAQCLLISKYREQKGTERLLSIS